jgi:phosphonate transport system substrate-binding protein
MLSSNPPIFACDVNLGFPEDDPRWSEFFRDNGWRVDNYEDLDQLTEILKAHVPAAAFLPAANYYYFKADPHYTGLAMALAVQTGSPTVDSLLVVPETASARSIMDLKGKRLGDINSFCTTSYFSPAILLSESNTALKNFFSTIQPTGAWQRQIDAVKAGEVDATMVEEGIWRSTPENQLATKVIGRVEGLPAPVIIIAKSIDPAFASAFLSKLCSTTRAAPGQPFAGFTAYRTELVDRFFKRVDRATALGRF